MLVAIRQSNEMNSGGLRKSQSSKCCLLADEVLDYMLRHPEAQDTVEGIAEWWLLERRVARALAEVEAALGTLVAGGFLVANRAEDGRTHYRLNREKQREARRHLRKSESGRQKGSTAPER
jgi:hypothetical protein